MKISRILHETITGDESSINLIEFNHFSVYFVENIPPQRCILFACTTRGCLAHDQIDAVINFKLNGKVAILHSDSLNDEANQEIIRLLNSYKTKHKKSYKKMLFKTLEAVVGDILKEERSYKTLE